MKGRIHDIELIKLRELKVENIILNEYNVEIVFERDSILIIEEYWEYVDEKHQIIDRQLSSKFRKEFRLNEVIGAQVVGLEKIAETFYFFFNNKNVLKVSSPDFEYMGPKRYKAFGDGWAPGRRGWTELGDALQ